MKSPDGLFDIPLKRIARGYYSATIRGINFRFYNVAGTVSDCTGWNLEIDGEVNDRYATLRDAVENAAHWALEFGE